jgi:hypothetical protein
MLLRTPLYPRWVLRAHVALYRKYRYMDANLTQRRQVLEEKIPDIQKTLTMVEYLQERRVSVASLHCLLT